MSIGNDTGSFEALGRLTNGTRCGDVLKRLWSKFTPGLALGVCVIGWALPAQAENLLQDASFANTVPGNGPQSPPWGTRASHGGQAKVVTVGTVNAPKHAVSLYFAHITSANPVVPHLAVFQPLKTYIPNDSYRIEFHAKNLDYREPVEVELGSQVAKVTLGTSASDTFIRTLRPTGNDDDASFLLFQSIGDVIEESNGVSHITIYQKKSAQVELSDLYIVNLDTPEIDPRYGVLPAAFAASVLLMLAESRRKPA